jgi:hypothetical protein
MSERFTTIMASWMLRSLSAVERDCEVAHLLDGDAGREAYVTHDDLGMHPLLDKRLHLLQDLDGQEYHRRGVVPDLGILLGRMIEKDKGNAAGQK